MDTGITTFVVVDAGAFIGLTTTSVNDIINTYSFAIAPIPSGSSYEGGYLICGASPIRWVVSPYSAEVTRCWVSRNDANTRAQAVSGCTGWFVPTCGQLHNPGYLCRSFWGPSPCYSNNYYLSSTEATNDTAWAERFCSNVIIGLNKIIDATCVRSFRCVTY
jgi:hypothetical protein